MTCSRLSYYHWLFHSAALFNTVIAISFIFFFDALFQFVGGNPVPDLPLLHLFIEITGFAILLFGYLYFHAGRRVEKPESAFLMAFGAVGKVVIFVLMLRYTLAGHLPWGLMAVAVIDLIYALLFLECIRYKSRSVESMPQRAP